MTELIYSNDGGIPKLLDKDAEKRNLIDLFNQGIANLTEQHNREIQQLQVQINNLSSSLATKASSSAVAEVQNSINNIKSSGLGVPDIYRAQHILTWNEPRENTHAYRDWVATGDGWVFVRALWNETGKDAHMFLYVLDTLVAADAEASRSHDTVYIPVRTNCTLRMQCRGSTFHAYFIPC